MQTICPTCFTIYKVSEKQLNSANSKVRCAKCKFIFDGRAHLVDEDQTLSIHDIRQSIRNYGLSSQHRLVWYVLLICSIFFLSAQFMWLQRASLADNDNIGHYITTICANLSFCSIPVKREPSAFLLTSRQLYSHPNEKNALILSASFSNGADFAQVHPRLLVSMSNKLGEVVAERYFMPTEYLDQKEHLSESNVVLPNQNLDITVTFVDPGKDALAFEVDFL